MQIHKICKQIEQNCRIKQFMNSAEKYAMKIIKYQFTMVNFQLKTK